MSSSPFDRSVENDARPPRGVDVEEETFARWNRTEVNRSLRRDRSIERRPSRDRSLFGASLSSRSPSIERRVHDRYRVFRSRRHRHRAISRAHLTPRSHRRSPPRAATSSPCESMDGESGVSTRQEDVRGAASTRNGGDRASMAGAHSADVVARALALAAEARGDGERKRTNALLEGALKQYVSELDEFRAVCERLKERETAGGGAATTN